MFAELGQDHQRNPHADGGIRHVEGGPMIAANVKIQEIRHGTLPQPVDDVAKAISTFEDRQKAEARAKVEALARDLGYSLAELVGTETKTARAPVAAKYRHPENAALTWSGRGRKPLWFVDALEAGKTPGELAIG